MEEYCSQTSLFNFTLLALNNKAAPTMRHLWRLEHLASECAALMDQVRRSRAGVDSWARQMGQQAQGTLWQ